MMTDDHIRARIEAMTHEERKNLIMAIAAVGTPEAIAAANTLQALLDQARRELN